MFIKSQFDRNPNRVNLSLVVRYTPTQNRAGMMEERTGSTPVIVFVHPDGRISEWFYDSVEERDAELLDIDLVIDTNYL